MNKRIENFMWEAKAFAKHQQLVDYDFLEKFAELIVQECAKVADDGYASSNFGNGITGHQLLAHFGVEE